MEAPLKKDGRIEFRISPEGNKIFRKAQKLSGAKTFSEFITRTIRAKAQQVIEENERILDSDRDKEIFFQAIFGDTKPNKALSEAARKFKSIQQ